MKKHNDKLYCEVCNKRKFLLSRIKKAIKIIKEKESKRLWYYKCEYCKCFHLTHKNQFINKIS